jgi:uncharacterized membrane protein HdeD (DUF308 family)
MAALFALGAETVEVKGKPFDRDHALESGVGRVDAAHLPLASRIIRQLQLIGCVVPMREIESLEREIKCGYSRDIDHAGLDADTGQADVFRNHPFLNPRMDRWEIPAFPDPGTGVSICLHGTDCATQPAGRFFDDKVGRKTMVLLFSAGCAIAVVPLLLIVNTGVHSYALSALLGFSLIVGPGNACYSVWAAERFPRSLRASGMGLSYNIAAGIMGGMTPLICTSLMAATHSRIAPAAWILFASLITILTSLRAKETGGKPLR